MSAEQDTAMFDQPDGDTRPATRLSRNLLLARLGEAERERDALAATIKKNPRIQAWDVVASHAFFRECYDTDGRLIDAMVEKLSRSTAALEAVQETAWDACLDAIEHNELNTAQAREGNPYRKTDTKDNNS